MKPFRLVLVAAMIVMPLQEALAADWQLVLSDRNRRVEIDRSSIFSSDRGTKVSWGRVVLTNEEAASAGYATIKALNRYDCQNRSFVTVKRVYLDISENLVREESVADQTPLRVTPNSVDERMWREVCNPPSPADLQKLAGEVQKLAEAMQPAAATAAKPTPPASAAVPSVAQPASGRDALAAERGARPTPIDARDTSVRPIRTAETAPMPDPPKPSAAVDAPAAASDVPPASIVPPLPSIRPPKPDPETLEPRPGPQVRAEAPVPTAKRSTPARKVEAPPEPQPARAAYKPRPPSPVVMAKARIEAPQAQAAAAQTLAPDALEALLNARRQGASGPGWSYEGDTGPAAWGRLRPDWRTCSEGMRQSPIDLREGLAVDLAPIKFHYRSTGFRIRDTGNTLQVEVGGGMGMEVRGVRYELERFTLHRPSPERIGGMAYDMAMYLEHHSADGRRAILSVLLKTGAEADPLLQTLWNNLPLDRGREFVPDAIIDLAAFLPTDPAHFLYMGSLPTPPCTEDVVWAVMKTPVGISDDQLALFARLYPRNARPIQPTNGRLILESR